MKHLLAIMCLLLLVATAQAQDYRYQVVEMTPWHMSGGTINSQTLDANNDWVETVFQAADDSGVITEICAYFTSETGTGPIVKIGLETVSATTGIGSGTYKTGTGECSGTFNTNGQTAGWKCVTPTGTTCSIARGEWVATTVRYSSGTIDGANYSVWALGIGSQFSDSEKSGNNFYAVGGVAGTGTKGPGSEAAMYMYKTSTRVFGRPWASASTQSFSSDSASDEYAMRFKRDCPAGETYKLVGIRWWGQTANTGKTAVIALYNDTTVLQDVTWDTDWQRDTSGGNNRAFFQYFDETSLVDLDCGTVYRVGLQAGSTSMGWALAYFDVAENEDFDAYPGGIETYLSHRADGGSNAWTDVTTRRPLIDLIIDKDNEPDAGGSGGGGGSVSIMTRDITVSEATGAERRIPLYLVDATDGLTEETGLSISGSECRVSKNGAASANCAGSITENETGLYAYEPTTGEVDTVGYVTVRISDSAARKFIGVANINAFDFTTASPTVTVAAVNTGVIENGDFAARGTLQSVTAGPPGTATLAATEAFQDNVLAKNTALHIVSGTNGVGQTKCICSNVGSTDVVTLCEAWDGATPTGTLTYNLVPAPHCDAIQPATAGRSIAVESNGAVSNINGIQVAALADLFDTDSGTTYGSAISGSVVKEIADNAGGSSGGDFMITSGTAQSITAGPPAKMRLAASATYADKVLNDHTAVLILTSSGNTAAVGQVLCIKNNVASNDEVTFTRPYKSVPSGTVTYAVIPAPNCNPSNWPKDL